MTLHTVRQWTSGHVACGQRQDGEEAARELQAELEQQRAQAMEDAMQSLEGCRTALGRTCAAHAVSLFFSDEVCVAYFRLNI